ncbi:colicin D domain-containing protein [Shewanella waksmanii]|uniref:colicin D domain-containing protein n=1 Tax=Shewanella waksmanii TaxID=213783 RepID=UPI0004B7A22E|nr:colicin D domain-containing protein [Shewanella waksmanii]
MIKVLFSLILITNSFLAYSAVNCEATCHRGTVERIADRAGLTTGQKALLNSWTENLPMREVSYLNDVWKGEADWGLMAQIKQNIASTQIQFIKNINITPQTYITSVNVALAISGFGIVRSTLVKASQVTIFNTNQLTKKFKHAIDFGISTTKKNPKTINEFKLAIKKHMDDPITVQRGTYGLAKDSKVFFNVNTNNVVVLSKSDEFITGFKLIKGTPQFNNYLKKGFLR